MNLSNSMNFGMPSCIKLSGAFAANALIAILRPLGAISLYIVDRISFSPQGS
ncbi:hypothetical protein GCM10007052_11960 [Halioglobus japonicus]|uniref:hypothetical protein n=1 Tax=Halioglobus japonicus TaxID=930805 RepID=UPI0012F502BE|nr:hypothetical protein [Halioglobus japonicus]GHD11805.1 hypothetical protein GCM10007052_11960 [Halioglobus japonicus]